ncbi:GlxA family transcriptional regulator [Thalassiella azotivora]
MIRSAVAIALPGVAPFELGVVCEVFGIDRREHGVPLVDFAVVTPEPGRVPTSTGFALDVADGLDRAAGADVVLVPAYPRDQDVPAAVTRALDEAVERGAWVVSVCSGAFALGAAGLLDGRRCTTHWMYAGELAQRFPGAKVDPHVLYVEDDGVITSAGSAAGIDACLHLVRTEMGAGAAAAVARRMVVPPHRDGGQAQYVASAVPACSDDGLAPTLAWMVEHLSEDLRVEDVAARALMSPRTFARRFRAATGATPAAWLNQQRMQRARELLEATDLPVEEVARRVGFGSGAVLRSHFAALGTTPRAYRRTFAGPDLAADAARGGEGSGVPVPQGSSAPPATPIRGR